MRVWPKTPPGYATHALTRVTRSAVRTAQFAGPALVTIRWLVVQGGVSRGIVVVAPRVARNTGRRPRTVGVRTYRWGLVSWCEYLSVLKIHRAALAQRTSGANGARVL